jgi:hypothetical protein
VCSLTLLFSAQNLDAGEKKTRSEELLARIDKLWRGDSSHGKFSMHVKTEHYERKIGMETWTKGKEKSLVRIYAPKKEKGTATLKSGKTIYTYLPKTDRTIRLTSGMMGGSWMGSHFTNDDLVKESSLEVDYTSGITFEGKRGGVDIIEITLTAKPDAAVVWGKIVIEIFADNYLPIIEFFYDEDEVLIRTMVFEDIKVLGGRKFPAVMKIIPEDKPGEFTELVYHEMEFNIKLKDSLFSVSHLRRM